jgi:hypothetical protein
MSDMNQESSTSLTIREGWLDFIGGESANEFELRAKGPFDLVHHLVKVSARMVNIGI